MPDSYLNSTSSQSQHESEDLDWDVTPSQARKRRLGATTGTDPQPLKRTRPTEAHKTTSYHPEPKAPPGRSASSLRDFAQLHHDSQAYVSEWLESLPEARCRSGSNFFHSAALTQEPTRPVSEMGKPASTGPQRYRQDVGAGSVATSDLAGTPPTTSEPSFGRSLVADPSYRRTLTVNKISLRKNRDPKPAFVTGIVDRVRQGRNSPGPSLDEIRQDEGLQQLETNAVESDVEEYFRDHLFPRLNPADTLQRTVRMPMFKRTVPDSGSKQKVSTPKPDILYGYNQEQAFPQQDAQMNLMGIQMVANSRGLTYPFFAIEFKGDGPSGAGGFGVIRPVDTAAFSIAMNGTEARLFISWKHDDLHFYMAKVGAFLLQEPEQYREFRKHVLNIIDWGKTERLKQIQDSLDSLLEQGEQQASCAAKSPHYYLRSRR
ncbi:hypothetical protein RB595_010445 [Gaeumannomyces hyphopodioides]